MSDPMIEEWPAVRTLGLRLGVGGLAIVLAVAFLLPGDAHAQKAYPSAESAAEALTAAIASGKPEDLNDVLGDDFRRFIPTDSLAEGVGRLYLDAWAMRHSIVSHPDSAVDDVRAVAVGDGDWTLPIPLVNSEMGWRFDVIKGAEEMKTRRVGRNELATIKASLAYCDAQHEYAVKDHNGDGQVEYAQRIISTPGETNGLYWARLDDDDDESPLGPLFGNDEIETPYHGYQYRILKSQGANASGGATDYVVDGAMTEGFALVAWPSKYDDTGVMTFIVNQDEVVYQSDLGAETDRAARTISRFDPTAPKWKLAELEEDD
jgi:hypothetical protein